MKIVLAPDKYKGSLTGVEFCNIVEEGILSVFPNCNIIQLPLADGGDGTIEVLDYHLKGKRMKVKVNDPLFRPITAHYFLMDSISTAYIEMAEASGMKLLTKNEQNCMHTSTYGTGEMILDAIDKGAKTIVLGIGGSATNDCGMGMSKALGYNFLNKNNESITPIGKNLIEVKSIDTSQVISSLDQVEFKVANDVTNPLYGTNGAAYVYALQKGASVQEIDILDMGLRQMSSLLQHQFGKDPQEVKGGGAGGGLGAGAYYFLNANMYSGIDLIKDIINFDDQIKDADWIITGEGQLDKTSFSGKTIGGVLNSANKFNIPVAAFCGNIVIGEDELSKKKILYAASILERAKNLEDAIENSAYFLKQIAVNFGKSVLLKS